MNTTNCGKTTQNTTANQDIGTCTLHALGQHFLFDPNNTAQEEPRNQYNGIRNPIATRICEIWVGDKTIITSQRDRIQAAEKVEYEKHFAMID